MLKKKYRLTKAKDIKVTSVRGQAFFNAYFTLKFSPASLPTPLCTVVVSTKISTKAVERNRGKL
jgi:ribonuclease P protein component